MENPKVFFLWQDAEGGVVMIGPDVAGGEVPLHATLPLLVPVTVAGGARTGDGSGMEVRRL